MSDATKQAVEDALAAHIADEMNGAILTGWWVVLCGSDMERPGVTCYYYDGPATQPFHATLGLHDMSSKYLDGDYHRSGDGE